MSEPSGKKCERCGGTGSYGEHSHQCSPETGCKDCPVQVECSDCYGTGFVEPEPSPAPVKAEAIGPDFRQPSAYKDISTISSTPGHIEFQQAILEHGKLVAELSEAVRKGKDLCMQNGQLMIQNHSLVAENEKLRALSIKNLGDIQALEIEIAAVKKERDALQRKWELLSIQKSET